MQTRCLTLLLALLASASAALVTQTPGRWHIDRRAAILEAHPEVAELAKPEPLTLPLLAAINAAQIGCAVSFAHAPTPALVPLGIFVGGTLSLWQFALLHDVKHGTAVLPDGVSPNDVLFAGSLPSLFGYFLYLRYGHLTHHKEFGRKPLRDLFNSKQANFEDGDALFIAHRQQMPLDEPHKRVGFFGKDDVGGLGLSISRTIYSLLWIDGSAPPTAAPTPAAAGGSSAAAAATSSAAAHYGIPAWNAAVFAFSMTFERAALVFGGGVVPALVGRNYFFDQKPDAFHQVCAQYARVSLVLALALYAAAGPGAIAWLFWAEVGWQLPIHPACAMFVSNHPSLEAPGGTAAGANGADGLAGAACQPTASVYLPGPLGEAYDWLCCFSNFHTEHHDFPDVPAFKLRELRDACPSFYSDEALAGCRDGWLETMRRTFEGRGFYACSGVGAGAALSEAEIRLEGQSS